tara:strand:+ start:1177 stop:1749 length:573 start_codon:yes stop_codon:yes gene_type:complete
MFILKKKYFFMIESIKDIQLSNIKKPNKLSIIYRNKKSKDKIPELFNFRKLCGIKKIKFFISNDLNLCKDLKADGIYISANNFNLKFSRFKNYNLKIIGSAHNRKEILIKKQQGCSEIIFSRLFKTSYDYKKGYLGIVKFNLFNKSYNDKLVPLGGIRLDNLNRLQMLKSSGLVIFSEIKKKPAIIDRLF